MLHVDQIADLIKSKAPTSPRVVGVADAGLFMDLPSYKGEYTYTPLFKDIYEFQQVSRSLGTDCKSKHTQDDAYKCFIGQYAINYVKTPMFITNSLYDVYQHYRFMVLQCNPVPGATHGVCNKNHITYMNNYRDTMVDTIEKYLKEHPESGAWAVSCWIHPIKNHENFWDDIKAGESKAVAATLKKTFIANNFGPSCIQFPNNKKNKNTRQSEDCLTLNIFTNVQNINGNHDDDDDDKDDNSNNANGDVDNIHINVIGEGQCVQSIYPIH